MHTNEYENTDCQNEFTEREELRAMLASEGEGIGAATELPEISVEIAPLKRHVWNASGFCVYCHNTHRTDFRQNDLCDGQTNFARRVLANSFGLE